MLRFLSVLAVAIGVAGCTPPLATHLRTGPTHPTWTTVRLPSAPPDDLVTDGTSFAWSGSLNTLPTTYWLEYSPIQPFHPVTLRLGIGPRHLQVGELAMSRDWIVWLEESWWSRKSGPGPSDIWGIRAFNRWDSHLYTVAQSPAPGSRRTWPIPAEIALDGDRLVWTTTICGPCGGPWVSHIDMRRLPDGPTEHIQVTRGWQCGITAPAFSGGLVAWTQGGCGGNGVPALVLYDLRTRRMHVLSRRYAGAPLISGTYVAWEESLQPSSQTARIMLLDTRTGKRRVLARGHVGLMALGRSVALWLTESADLFDRRIEAYDWVSDKHYTVNRFRDTDDYIGGDCAGNTCAWVRSRAYDLNTDTRFAFDAVVVKFPG